VRCVVVAASSQPAAERVFSKKPPPPSSPPTSRRSALSGDAKRSVDEPPSPTVLDVTPGDINFGRRSICMATVRTVEVKHVGEFSLRSVAGEVAAHVRACCLLAPSAAHYPT
jgi:hypothetical protein